MRLAFLSLLAAILSGCANSPLDRDTRAKVQDVVPASVTITGVPPSFHFDFFRVDFRVPVTQPLLSPSPK